MEEADNDPLLVIDTPPPAIPADAALGMLTETWRCAGRLSPLISERDQNFRVDAAGGRRYVLKIANRAESEIVTLFQIEALKHIEKNAVQDALSVPRIIPTAAGESFIRFGYGGHDHVARLVSWVDGVPPPDAIPDAALCHSIGRSLALLGRWLAGFTHPGENQSLLWDMKRATDLRIHLPLIPDTELRQAVASALDDFELVALPAMQELRWQVIHHDAHPDNLLVHADAPDTVSGIIDFGDMLRSPLIVDLGVSAAYMHGEGGSPLERIRAFVAGYRQVTPLSNDEVRLLYFLVRARLAATVAICRWRVSARHPDDPYLAAAIRAVRGAERFLKRVTQFTPDEFFDAITGD